MKEALILFSGGKDSFLSTLLILEKGYKVNLITYENGCGLKAENAIDGAKRIQDKYGKDKVKIFKVQKIDAIWREFLYLYYNNKPSENLEKYGDIPISQFNCLSCRLAMYVMSIIIARKNNIDIIVDGARNSQHFAIEQNELLERFNKFFEEYELNIEYPLKDLEDDFELKNQILVRGFVPKTLEPQCLLGMPLDKNKIDKEIINATINILEKLLKNKAKEMIEKYKDIDIVGEYL